MKYGLKTCWRIYTQLHGSTGAQYINYRACGCGIGSGIGSALTISLCHGVLWYSGLYEVGYMTCPGTLTLLYLLLLVGLLGVVRANPIEVMLSLDDSQPPATLAV